MKSIRLSLILYYLLLLGTALGAVSWLVYQSSAQTLQDKVASQRKLLLAECNRRCDEARAALDRRLLQRAHTLAGLARSTFNHYESLYFIGLMGTPALPQGHLFMPIWLAETYHPHLMGRLFRTQNLEIFIESAEDIMPAPEAGKPREYFQTYRLLRGQLIELEGSKSLGDHRFTLDDQIRQETEPLKEYFDTVELSPGLSVRRVTLQVPVTRFRPSPIPPRWDKIMKPPFFGKGGKYGPPPPLPFRPRPQGSEVPYFFLQYASDTAFLEADLAKFRAQCDEELAQLEEESAQTLLWLRRHLLLVSLATFAATVAGGFLFFHLSLRPLRRLSEAVGQVSAKDFHLPIDQAKLPKELRPVASRLAETLQLLKRAFAREKQAAADISHELRTPLAALLTTLDVALRKPRSPEEYRDLLRDCLASGQHMNQLVERLLALARLDAEAALVQLQDVDVAELAQNCADMVRPLAEERGLALQVHATPPTILKGDPDKLREILNNLLHNAIEYNKPHGTIDLAVKRANGHVHLEVRDTGIGIPPEHRERIFERFFRGDPSRQAEGLHAGLGLAIVKGYVDLLGGDISVDSNEAGTLFHVSLPIRED